MSTLFDVTTSGKLTLPNRFVRAAIGAGKIDGKMVETFENVAKGGVGTILTGFTLVSSVEKSFPLLALYDDSFIESHKQLIEAAHKHNAKIILQIVYIGSYVMGPVDHTILGPSAVEHFKGKVTPQEATVAQIKEIQQNFAATALRAKNAGYDGVEIHGAHSFFLSLFLNTYYNKRTDAYGGSLENRARNAVETVAAVRAAVGPDYPVWIKINVTEETPTNTTYPAEDLLAYANLLAGAGVNGIEISGAFMHLGEEATSYFKKEAAAIADAVADKNVIVILTGGNRSAAEMTELLHTTKIGYFGLARPLMKNPNFINDLKKDVK